MAGGHADMEMGRPAAQLYIRAVSTAQPDPRPPRRRVIGAGLGSVKLCLCSLP
jgi:hypothetical protein